MGTTSRANYSSGDVSVIDTATNTVTDTLDVGNGPIAVATAVVPAQAPTPDCANATPTITGTNGNDTITGTPGNDVIFARGGNDKVGGGDGNDLVC
ncbi:hypothetical protein ACFVEN_26175 [Streptomyces sp. NPDC057681]|uniref:hypothetical protein n=1 Tax=Streptomyces sp. NPDC057681 TaxID=3346209 RepID=UPI003676C842